MKIKLLAAFLIFTNIIWANTDVAAPANDNFADATPISCGQNYTGSTLEATLDEDDAPNAVGVDLDGPNIWYSYTGSGIVEMVTLDFCASGFDTSYLVYTGTSGNLTLVAANDDNVAQCGPGYRSYGTFESDGTTTYYITVNGYNAADIGAVDLTVSCIPEGSILIPDANFEQALIDLGIDSGVINGYISPTGLDQINDLDVSNKSISDLTGIEAFTSLLTLNCSNNNLSELDVTNSTALTAIILNDNTLTDIDVTNNIVLETINLNNNVLTSLDVSQNLALEDLKIRTNNLSGNLDTSQNLALEVLEVMDNSLLSTLDLPVNSPLRFLVISGTQITNIDLTQSPALDNFYAINCGLTSLDLFGNPALETLVLSQNTLTSLDLSANPVLTIFSCQNMNSLIQLNIQNGNNAGILNFNALSNSNLTCIQVDDAVYSANVWINIDAGTSFNTDCGYLTNDECVDAVTIISDDSCNATEVGTLLGATDSNSLHCDGNLPNFSDIWFSFVATEIAHDIKILNATGPSNTISHAVINAQTYNCGNITEAIYCTDVLQSEATGLTIGDTYYIQVYSYEAAINATFDICVSIGTSLKTYVPDDNFEQALIDLGYDDILNDYVLTENINTVEVLDVSNKNISDLTGIEDFTALTSLEISLNDLTTVNLTQNTALTRLDSEFSPLTTIDISQNVLLSYVRLNGANFTTLDVTNNTALETLILTQNQLTSLDVSQNLVLGNLTVYNSHQLATIQFPVGGILHRLNMSYTQQLTNIDFSQIPTLSALYADAAGLTSIDVSENPALVVLFVSENLFTSIDVSDNPALLNFYAKGMSSLVELNVQNGNNTALTLFDITGNENLTCVKVDDVAYSTTNWTNIDPGVNFSLSCTETTYVPDNNFEQALIDLGYDDVLDDYVSTNNINNVQTLHLVELQISDLTGIEDFTALTSLECFNNNLTSLNISQNVALTYLGIEYNSLGTIDISQNVLLKNVRASNNNLTAINVTNNTVLESLIIYNNQLINLDVSQNLVLETLECYSNNLTNIDVSQNVALKHLDVGLNGLATINVTQNTLLESLNCSDNNLTTIDVTNNTALTSVNLNYNLFTSINFLQNIALEELFLVNNSQLSTITLPVNVGLKRLAISGTQLTDIDLSQIPILEDFYAISCGLTSIDVSGNPALKRLYIGENLLTNIDISANPAITVLFCPNNSSLVELNAQNGNNTDITTFNTLGNVNLVCIQVDDVAYSTANWTNIESQTSFSEFCGIPIQLAAKVYLQGAMLQNTDGFMRTDLKDNNHVPSVSSPYADGIGASGTVFQATGQDKIVDWVWVELRDATDPTIIIDGKSALLQRDGDIVDASASDAATPVSFNQVSGDYYVVIKHRNHLGIMSNNMLSLSDVVTTVDFTNANNQITYGANAQTTFGMPTNTVGMWCGNVNGDAVVQYAGTTPDTPALLSTILNDVGNFLNFPTYVLSGYNTNDINMDGTTQYAGTIPDTPFILQNTLAHPGNFLNFSTYQIMEQLPENE